MTKEQAKEQLRRFLGDKTLTFIIKSYPGEEWVAQCNEIDSIITGGIGYDQAAMENLMQDAILTAAGIPRELSENLLKRVWSNNVQVTPKVEVDINSTTSLFQSTYRAPQHARVG